MCSPDQSDQTDQITSQPPSLLKILLAEDNLTNQKLTLRQLQLLGYQADIVVNGQVAVDAVMQSHYDLVLMDCQMPVLDGFDATAAIRAWEQQSQRCPVVVIAMTASDLERDRQRALAIGMNDYLTKPIRKEVLGSLLDYWNNLILTKSNFAARTAVASPTQVMTLDPLPPLHLDWEQLQCLSDHTPEFELELLQLFLQDSSIHLKVLQQAAFHQDFQQIRQSAHHIKGASANVGAKMMQSLAEQIEHQSDLKQGNVTAELIARLEFSLAQVQTFLNRIREETWETSRQ